MTPWTVAHQAPLSTGFHRQAYWNRLPFPSPGDLPNPEIDPKSPALADWFPITETPRRFCIKYMNLTYAQLTQRNNEKTKWDMVYVCVCACGRLFSTASKQQLPKHVLLSIWICIILMMCILFQT